MFPIPPLTIQTIPENCLKHGRPKTIPTKDSFLIKMKAQIEQNTLTISITDNGSGFGDKQKSSGAIQNIKQRLEHHYSTVQVILENQQKGGARITILFFSNFVCGKQSTGTDSSTPKELSFNSLPHTGINCTGSFY
jgi:LytS/YehU family sensor histidine kinase